MAENTHVLFSINLSEASVIVPCRWGFEWSTFDLHGEEMRALMKGRGHTQLGNKR